jgi:hypothetical protein
MAVAALVDAVSGVAGLDMSQLTDAELHDVVMAVQRERDRLAVVAGQLLAEWDDRRVWTSNGALNATQRLSVETHTSRQSAKRELAVAGMVDRLPEVAAAVLDGRLSLEHVGLFARVVTPEREPWFERDCVGLIARCERVSLRDGERILRYWADAVDSETPEVQPAPEPPSRAWVSTTFEGNVVGDFALSPIDGAIVTGELDRLVDQLRAHPPDDIERTAAEWRALALVEMAIRSRTAPTGGRRPQPLFTVHVGPHVFERLCELANGAVLHTDQLAPHLEEAVYETMLFGSGATLVAVSPRRTFTGMLRRAIVARDRRCTHPSGCDIPAERCDVDHSVAWSQGGATDQFTGRLECRPHNRRHDLHDHHTPPRVGRPPDFLDVVRTQLAWQFRRNPPPDDDPGDER